MQSFLPSLRRGRRKKIDVFRFSPSSLSRACYIPKPYDRGWVYTRTSNQTGTGYRRLYTNRHQRGVGVSSHVAEDVSPLCHHEFRLYAVYYTVGICRQCRNNGAFHMPPATKVFAVRPSVSSTYLTRSNSLFRHRFIFARRKLKLDKILLLIWC